MKICLINNLYKPYARGGAEIIVEQVAQGLTARGHQVFIITTRPLTGAKPEQEAQTDVKIYRYRVLNFVSYHHLDELPKIIRIFWHLADMFDLGSFFKVRGILKKERPDFVLTHNLKGAGYLIPRAVRGLKIKQLHTLHDIQLLHPSGLLYCGREKQIKRPPAKFYSVLCRWLFNSPWLVISPSGWLLNLHQELGFFKRVKTAVLANPAPSPPAPLPLLKSRERGVKESSLSEEKFFNKPPLSHEARNGSGAGGEGRFRFIYVGQIEKHKGILFLIKVFKLFSPELEKNCCQLVVAGDGSKLKTAKYLAAGDENIIFLDRLERNDALLEMERADALILPSLCYENSPGVIYEAMSLGLPVIASRLGGIPELIRQGEGLLFNPGNEGDLMYQMKWALKHRAELQAMGDKARRKMAEYSLDKYIEKLESLF